MRNVVLLCLDAVRKDYFDEYAPRLHERADTVYQQCRVASGWSIPSHASLLSGELPHVHGVHSHSREYTKLDSAETFLADLPEHTAIGVSANPYVSQRYGFDSFFDVFSQVCTSFQFEKGLSPCEIDPSETDTLGYLALSLQHRRPVRSLANGLLIKYSLYDSIFSGRPWPERYDTGTKATLSRASAHIAAEERVDNPVCAFLNVMEAHLPMYHHRGLDRDLHSVPNTWTSKGGPSPREVSHHTDEYREYVRNYRQLYGAAIDYLDRHLDAWVEEIQDQTDNETTVVVTADHGENLGAASEDHLFDHHSSLTEATLHVPLLLINPPEGYPETESRFVSHLELGELLVRLAHDEPFEFSDRPVTAEVIGHTGETPGGAYWDRALRSLYDDDRKTTWDSLGTTSVFELETGSPCTQTEVETNTGAFPRADETMFETSILEAKRAALESATRTDTHGVETQTKQNLTALGYR